MAHTLTRRRFLAGGAEWIRVSLLAGIAGKRFGALARASSGTAPEGAWNEQMRAGSPLPTDARGMIVYSEEYITREMPVSFFASWITPTEHFFVRNNEHM